MEANPAAHPSFATEDKPLRPVDAKPEEPPASFFTVHAQDARRLDMLLSQYSSPKFPLLTATITSPPYGALKDYGHSSQIGYGQPEDEYFVDLRRIFRSTWQHTKPDGAMWVVADTLRVQQRGNEVWPLKLLPFEIAREAEKVGWTLRDSIVWIKDKTLPWSGRGRMRNAFEHILFFVKSPEFKYRLDRLREPNELEQWWVRYPERYNPQGKAPSNVWAVPIPVQGSWANTEIQHACPLPADLIERMVLLSTDEGDVVLDPFAGSGVVVAEAERLERHGLGIELVQRYVDAFHSTVRPEITERRGSDLLQERSQESSALQETILDLRAVKFPKVVLVEARRIDPTLPAPFAAYAFRRGRKATSGRTKLDLVIALRPSDMARADDFRRAAIRAGRRRPASKFGIDSEVRITSIDQLSTLHRGRRLWGYVAGRTHATVGRCNRRRLDELAAEPSRYNIPPILCNVKVDEQPRPLRGRTDA